jgi:hypothetical protein
MKNKNHHPKHFLDTPLRLFQFLQFIVNFGTKKEEKEKRVCFPEKNAKISSAFC